MTDNIKPEHYRTGEIDLYEAFSQIFPHNEYRAGMQMIAMRYMFRNKIDRVEDLKKAIYTIERLKEKEIEHAEKNTKTPEEALADMGKAFGGMESHELIHNQEDDTEDEDENTFLLKGLLEHGFNYLARDRDDCLWVYGIAPKKVDDVWATCCEDKTEEINKYSFPEVKWTDNEPTKIVDLLATYQNG